MNDYYTDNLLSLSERNILTTVTTLFNLKNP